MKKDVLARSFRRYLPILIGLSAFLIAAGLFWYRKPIPCRQALTVYDDNGRSFALTLDVTVRQYVFFPRELEGTITLDGEVFLFRSNPHPALPSIRTLIESQQRKQNGELSGSAYLAEDLGQKELPKIRALHVFQLTLDGEGSVDRIGIYIREPGQAGASPRLQFPAGTWE